MLFAVAFFRQLCGSLCINVITIYHKVFVVLACLKSITVISGWKENPQACR